MIYEKAFKDLKRQVEHWENGTEFSYSLPPLKAAISALEKQIPKKVEVIDKNYGYYSCRVCGAGITYRTHKYCYRCGQALDWSDTE